MVRYSAGILGLTLALQLTLVWAAPARVQKLTAAFHLRPKIEGVSLLVDRIADSKYGLTDPLPDADAPELPILDTRQPIPVELRPDGPALIFKNFVGPEVSLWAPEHLRPIIERESQRNGVDPLLIEAIIRNESGFQPTATSPVGAQGLMQLMPDTAALVGVTDAYDPEQNIAGGTLYFSWQLKQFGGDVSLAVAAYNAGPQAVQRWGGIPPYQETIDYVQRVMDDYRAMMNDRPVH